MDFITLAVTQPVVQAVGQSAPHQRQLAIQATSPPLAMQLAAASAQNRLNINVGGTVPLIVGDTHAIWAVHQAPGIQTADFDNLYDLLSRRPGHALTLTW